MSRNKDRYESSNQRRQQVFMSPEDVAAGRKSNWTGVEITGVCLCIWLKECAMPCCAKKETSY